MVLVDCIGRVIRKGAEDKVAGLVCVPVYSKVGISTARKVEAVVDTVFNKGEKLPQLSDYENKQINCCCSNDRQYGIILGYLLHYM